MRRVATALLAAGLALSTAARALPPAPGSALPPPSTGGIPAVDTALKKLATNKRLLVIAAHPDDEDTPLLTLVSREFGGEAAYLSLSRGDGGQNLISDDLGIGLGLIRSEELNAARRLDGARQYFTRAYDFGYSRSLAEALRFWPKEAVLEDAVRIIRRFRPQVVVAIFSGTARDGHGQHQMSGIIAREAFRAAADPAAFPALEREGLKPWRPLVLFQTTRFLDRDKTTLTLSTSGIDPMTGRSFHQIAVASRSLHRSQGTGALQPLGPNEARLGWLEGGAGKDAKDPFDGIDTGLAALSAGVPDPARRREAGTKLARAEALARETRQRLSPADPSAAAAPIAAILEDLRSVRAAVDAGSVEGAYAAAVLDEKIAAAEAGLAAAAGIAMDALAAAETASPGETVAVTIQLWNAGRLPIEVEKAALTSPDGWSAEPPASGKTVEPGALAEWKLSSTLPADAPITVPYFLSRPLQGDLYDWSLARPEVRGEPFAPPPLSAVVTVRVSGTWIRITREATFRIRDETFGEIRRAVRSVPAVDISVEPDLIVWPMARKEPARVSVNLASNAPGLISGRVEATLPAGWKAAPAEFSLPKKGDRASFELLVTPPKDLKPGHFSIPIAAVLSDGPRVGLGIRVIDHQHIRPIAYARTAEIQVSTLDFKLPALARIGYVRGPSDRVPEALLAVGLPVQMLSSAQLEHGDLSRYDAIVVGARAYEIEPSLTAANGRLLEYVKNGGLLIVQYQQSEFIDRNLAPGKLELVRPADRVTDETVPVRLLVPNHPIFRTPNAIGESDWAGWVQERALYIPHTWADIYEPLLAMADPGEPEQRGSLLVARVGKGRYIYTGLALFRQLPAGVPGAYRLFANLLAWK